MYNQKAMTRVEMIVVIVIILLLVAIIIVPPIGKSKNIAIRLVCGTKLRGMSNAFNVYAYDNNDKYPVQGAGTHLWGRTTSGWDDPKKDWEKSTGTVTVGSTLYMLVREADIGVKSFVCEGSDEQYFVNETDHDIVELWDFGPNPTEHQSYSYHFPYGKFPADGTAAPENAIMADRSPWFDEKLMKSSIEKETAETFIDKVSLIDILTGTDKWKYQIGNSQPHDREGQNVLFNDGHVEFVKRSDVGKYNDNIFTVGGESETQKRKGTAPKGDKIDAFDAEDSLLVNDRKKHVAPASSRQL